jgi:Protein of unknown function (DUF5661)
MAETRLTTSEEARRVGDAIGVDWNRFDLEQFRFGMDVEFEHGSHDPQTDVTGDDPILTGKIALAHMKESPTTTSASSAWNRRQSATGPRRNPEIGLGQKADAVCRRDSRLRFVACHLRVRRPPASCL